MPKYAAFDPARLFPQQVSGWYDTDFVTYPNMPANNMLRQMSDQEWAQRMGLSWYNGATFMAPPPGPGASKPQTITATAFLNRIPQDILPVLYANAQTGVMLITLAAAQTIDLTDPQVQGGINALVPEILTADQAAAILDH
jgi:hypothetical protein